VFLGKKIDHIYLSTLKRTYQTMKPLINKGIPYSCEKDLDEFCFGNIEGSPIFDQQGNSILKEILTEWKNGNYHRRFEGGENPIEALERIKNGFVKILERDNEKQIIVCLHQRILRIVMCYLLGKPLSEMDKYPHHNTGISIVDFDLINNQFVLIELDNHSHLDE
jgi:probable phosphoglycerate mutase